MATHSSILAWRIPWTKEPGGVSESRTQLTTEYSTAPAALPPQPL